jgi:anti-sigma factor RsiW
MKIDCRQLADLLYDFVSGELPDDRLALLEEHLRLCPPCLVYVETYRVTIRLTRKLPPVPMPADCERRLREVLARECPGEAANDK